MKLNEPKPNLIISLTRINNVKMTAVEDCFDGNIRQDSESFVITSDFNRSLQQCCNFLVKTNNRDQKDLCLIYSFLYLILIEINRNQNRMDYLM